MHDEPKKNDPKPLTLTTPDDTEPIYSNLVATQRGQTELVMTFFKVAPPNFNDNEPVAYFEAQIMFPMERLPALIHRLEQDWQQHQAQQQDQPH